MTTECETIITKSNKTEANNELKIIFKNGVVQFIETKFEIKIGSFH
jgi:hypothetical protein